MNLATTALEALFGKLNDPLIEVGLGRTGIEVDDPGYERQTAAKGSWQVKDGTVSRAVDFGPFIRGVTFTHTLLFVNGERIDAQPLEGGGTQSLLPNMEATVIPVFDMTVVG